MSSSVNWISDRECVKDRRNRTLDLPFFHLPFFKQPSEKHSASGSEALEMAKFSIVYFQNGDLEKAEVLQTKVKDFACEELALGNKRARRAARFLAQTCILRSRIKKAAELLQEVLKACENTLGSDHSETIKIIDSLAAIRCQQGRFTESQSLAEQGVRQFTILLGPDHEDTLLAMETLARVTWHFTKYEQARSLHKKAADEMAALHGHVDEKTLNSKECVATAYLSIDATYLYDPVTSPENPLEIL